MYGIDLTLIICAINHFGPLDILQLKIKSLRYFNLKARKFDKIEEKVCVQNNHNQYGDKTL